MEAAAPRGELSSVQVTCSLMVTVLGLDHLTLPPWDIFELISQAELNDHWQLLCLSWLFSPLGRCPNKLPSMPRLSTQLRKEFFMRLRAKDTQSSEHWSFQLSVQVTSAESPSLVPGPSSESPGDSFYVLQNIDSWPWKIILSSVFKLLKQSIN
jgi:hypothetical protein